MSSGHVFGPADPTNSPLEKLLVPNKGRALWKLERDLMNSGLEADVARNLARAFKNYETEREYEELKNYQELEYWANRHTHPGGASGGEVSLALNDWELVSPGAGSWGLVQYVTDTELWAVGSTGVYQWDAITSKFDRVVLDTEDSWDSSNMEWGHYVGPYAYGINRRLGIGKRYTLRVDVLTATADPIKAAQPNTLIFVGIENSSISYYISNTAINKVDLSIWPTTDTEPLSTIDLGPPTYNTYGENANRKTKRTKAPGGEFILSYEFTGDPIYVVYFDFTEEDLFFQFNFGSTLKTQFNMEPRSIFYSDGFIFFYGFDLTNSAIGRFLWYNIGTEEWGELEGTIPFSGTEMINLFRWDDRLYASMSDGDLYRQVEPMFNT